MNTQEIINLFKLFMAAQGVEPPDIIVADGELHRFKVNGKLAYAYVLHLDGTPAGFFQDFRNGIKATWKHTSNKDVRPYTPAERRAYAIKCQAAEQQRLAAEAVKHQNAAHEAAKIWQGAPPAITHPYLTKKSIQPHGSRLYGGQALILPLYDASLRLMSLQFINLDGSKRFLKFGQKRGCYWWVGQKTEKVLIAEGFATVATLHESTGYQCFIAWDAGNLTSVAELIRAKKQNAEIVICADNDASGVGQREAEKAALAIDGLITMPPEPGTDFNDFAVKNGVFKNG
ncbi:MAG: toprim domain-containing protein [Methylococcales bacterium]